MQRSGDCAAAKSSDEWHDAAAGIPEQRRPKPSRWPRGPLERTMSGTIRARDRKPAALRKRRPAAYWSLRRQPLLQFANSLQDLRQFLECGNGPQPFGCVERRRAGHTRIRSNVAADPTLSVDRGAFVNCEMPGDAHLSGEE